MRRNRWSAVGLAGLLFGLGMVMGVLGYRYFAGPTVSAKTSETYRERYLSEMQSEVHLTSEQVTQLQSILDDTKARYRSLREQYRPALLDIKQTQIHRVEAILTPKQVPLYRALVAQRERRVQDEEERNDRITGRRMASPNDRH